MKDSRHFFLQATILLLKEHDKFIDVAHEDLTTNTQASDRFTLTLKSPLDARLKDTQSFSDNPKFLSGIQHTHVNLHKKLLSIPKGFRLHEHIQREFPYTFEFNRFRLNKNELFPVARGYEVGSFERYDYLADFRKQLNEMTSLFEWIEISYKEFSEQKELFLAQQEQLLLREKKLLEAHNDVIFYGNLLSLNEKVTGHRFVLRLPEAKDYL